jgi:hypothetical protein
MKLRIFALLLLAAGAYGQTAAFPAAVVTDGQLRVAANQASAPTINLPMGSTDTSVTVSNAAGIPINSVVTIDNENLAVCAVAGNVLSFGKSACPNVDGRGFDGSAAAAHGAGAQAYLNVDAWFHNATRVELEAIETALGANLANLAGPAPPAPPVPYVEPTAYAFTPQAPGGSLAAGNDTVALAPCPKGVNGADTAHYLYLSGGTGTAEAVPIIGGTCVSAASSGSVILTVANSHSGAWTVQSATAGIAEAAIGNAPAYIALPPGAYTVYATITPPAGTVIGGQGGTMSDWSGAPTTTINFPSTTLSLFSVTKDNVVIQNLKLAQTGGTATAGSAVNIFYDGSAGGAMAPRIENLEIEHFYDGLVADGTYNLELQNIQAYASSRYGFNLKGAQGGCLNLLAVSNANDGFHLSTATNNSNVTCSLDGGGTYDNGGWGLRTSTEFTQVSNLFLNNDALGELDVSAPGFQSAGIVSGINVQWAGGSTSWTNSNTAPGIRVEAGSGPIRAENTSFFNCAGNCVDFLSAGNQLIGAQILGAGSASQAGNIYAVHLAGGQHQIEGVLASGSLYIASGNQDQIVGDSFANGSTTPAVEFAGGTDHIYTGNRAWGATTALQIDAGASVAQAGNITLGAIVNNGTASFYGVNFTPVTFLSASFAQLSTINAASLAERVFCSDCAVNSNPCTGSGAGAYADNKPGHGWVCGP